MGGGLKFCSRYGVALRVPAMTELGRCSGAEGLPAGKSAAPRKVREAPNPWGPNGSEITLDIV